MVIDVTGNQQTPGLAVVFPEPQYVQLCRSGELERRALALEARLGECDICPRECRVDRRSGTRGFCRSAYLPKVASACAHRGEEPVLSGTRGSGTIFFSHCTLRCVYCQNHRISQPPAEEDGRLEVSTAALAEQMLYLQDSLGCHNINLVSPSHFVPQIVRALTQAIPMGLRVPLVYNTSGYDSLATLRALDGIVDIYLPDLRYASERWAREFSHAKGYVEHARRAIIEMFRQVGLLTVGEDGVARRGLIVRVLVLPNRIGGCVESLEWLARNISRDVAISVMSQYFPSYRARQVPLLSRRLTASEYAEAERAVEMLGLSSGWLQELDAPDCYVPDFDRDGHPFEVPGR